MATALEPQNFRLRRAELRKKMDEQLISLVAKKDEAAFEEIIRRYRNKLMKVADFFTRDHDEKEDIVQQVFIKVWSMAASYKGRGTFSAWICQIGNNQSRDLLKHQVSTRKMLIKNPFALEWNKDRNDFIDPKPIPDTVLESQEFRSSMRLAIGSLSSTSQEIVRLRYYEDLDYHAINRILNTHGAAPKMRAVRAREALRKILKTNPL